MSCLLTTLTRKGEVDSIIRDTIDKVLVLRFGKASDSTCLQLDDILAKSAREVSKFATIALVDFDSKEIQVYVKYFDITLIPSTIFFFNSHHMKMDSGTPDHTKWIGAFQRKQDFIDVIEVFYLNGYTDCFPRHCIACLTRCDILQLLRNSQVNLVFLKDLKDGDPFMDHVVAIFRGAMKGKLIVTCPLPPERIPRYQLLFQDV